MEPADLGTGPLEPVVSERTRGSADGRSRGRTGQRNERVTKIEATSTNSSDRAMHGARALAGGWTVCLPSSGLFGGLRDLSFARIQGLGAGQQLEQGQKNVDTRGDPGG